MSKPARSAPVPPPLPTRRQLDELEALLQRMLDLPVQQVEEERPAQENPREIEEPSRESFNDAPAAWDETTTDEVAEVVPRPAYSEAFAGVHAQWESAGESSLVLPETQPVEDFSPKGPADPESTAPRPIPEDTVNPPEIGQSTETHADGLASDLVQPEPGIFRILLGWSGLLCLILSLAILLLDWFGWTW